MGGVFTSNKTNSGQQPRERFDCICQVSRYLLFFWRIAYLVLCPASRRSLALVRDSVFRDRCGPVATTASFRPVQCCFHYRSNKDSAAPMIQQTLKPIARTRFQTVGSMQGRGCGVVRQTVKRLCRGIFVLSAANATHQSRWPVLELGFNIVHETRP